MKPIKVVLGDGGNLYYSSFSLLMALQALVPFRWRWSKDDWQMVNEIDSTATALGIKFMDIQTNSKPFISDSFHLFLD